MLALETTDVWAFTPAVIAAGHADYFTSDATKRDAYTSITAFVAWLNSPARAWYTSRIWTWSWSRNTADSGAILTLTCTGDFLFLGTMAGLGFTTHSAAPVLVGTASALGTWAPTLRIAVGRHQRLLGDGDCGGNNVVRPGVPGLAGIRPNVEAVGTGVDACRLTSILATAHSPRIASVYQVHTDAWRRYALGDISRDRDDNRFRFNLTCAGEVS